MTPDERQASDRDALLMALRGTPWLERLARDLLDERDEIKAENKRQLAYSDQLEAQREELEGLLSHFGNQVGELAEERGRLRDIAAALEEENAEKQDRLAWIVKLIRHPDRSLDDLPELGWPELTAVLDEVEQP